jgi:hypothetical protein
LEKKSFRDATAGVKVGICAKDESVLLTEKQLLRVERALTEAVVDSIGKGFQPRFEAFAKKEGILALTCTNEGTRDWVLTSVPTLKILEGVELRVVPGHEIPKNIVAVAWIPSEWRYQPQEVMHILGISNPGLNVRQWRTLNIKRLPNGQLMTFSLDKESAKALEVCNFRPYMGLCRITFRLKGQKPKEPQVCRDKRTVGEEGKPSGNMETTTAEPIPSTSSGAEIPATLNKPVEVVVPVTTPKSEGTAVVETSSSTEISEVLKKSAENLAPTKAQASSQSQLLTEGSKRGGKGQKSIFRGSGRGQGTSQNVSNWLKPKPK